VAARGEAGSAPPLLYAGRLLTHKRLDLLLGAVARLSAMPAAAGIPGGPLLTIFGEGPDRPRLERLAAELGIADRVVFRGHVATSEEVWRELGRARLAVQPSAREGFGLFPLEAMAAGLPVVYCESPESAVAELVRHGIEGIATPPDPEALAAGIATLLADPGAHARLAEAAHTRAAQYDWGEIARQIEEVCERLLASGPGRLQSPGDRLD
jgi:glycosyltransferase involved in cell wall biosynthesis